VQNCEEEFVRPQAHRTHRLSEDWLSVLIALVVVSLVWIGTWLGWSGTVRWPLFSWFT